VSPTQLQQLKLTEEGRYSITRPAQGYQIASIIKSYIPNSKSYNFVDGTAGMGGDLYYLAPLFKQSVGVEKNPEHASIAQSNLEVLGVKNVKVHNMSAIDYLKDNDSDVIEDGSNGFRKDFPNGIDVLWIDPPWGGPDYKKYKELDLFLDGKNIGEYVKSWLDNKIAKIVFIKAPVNYNMETVKGLGYKYKRFDVRSKHEVKFILILIW
jgi:16S rRNA G966 N2-methylase RsmD